MSYTDIRTNNQNLPPASGFENYSFGGGTKTLAGNVTTTNAYQLSNVTFVKGSYTLTCTNFYNRVNTQTFSVLPSDLTATNFYYDLAGAQSVMGGDYENLILGGSGVKTLRGNVTYTGTYTITGTATVNLNGFTITKIW